MSELDSFPKRPNSNANMRTMHSRTPLLGDIHNKRLQQPFFLIYQVFLRVEIWCILIELILNPNFTENVSGMQLLALIMGRF